MSSARGIPIAGVGTATGYGWGRDAYWDGLMSGESAVTPHDYHSSMIPDPVWAARIPAGGEDSDGPSRFARAMRSSIREAVADAKAHGWVPGDRVGIVHASVIDDVEAMRFFYMNPYHQMTNREYLLVMPSTTLSLTAKEHKFTGPVMSVQAMCASGNAGILTARNWLERGDATDVIMVATDVSAVPEHMRYMRDLGVLVLDGPPHEVCRPFQPGSRGFTAGEACAAMVLTNRTDDCYARFLGGSMSHDAFHPTSIDPSLDSIRRCFGAAIADAGVTRDELTYLHAHGPGTAQCDPAEAQMVAEFLPESAGLYTIKPMVGHCQGAASSIELAATVLSYDRGVVPSCPAGPGAHPQLIDLSAPHVGGYTLKSSLGMGGHNSVVVIGPSD